MPEGMNFDLVLAGGVFPKKNRLIHRGEERLTLETERA
jgi:hypothetical protein